MIVSEHQAHEQPVGFMGVALMCIIGTGAPILAVWASTRTEIKENLQIIALLVGIAVSVATFCKIVWGKDKKRH